MIPSWLIVGSSPADRSAETSRSATDSGSEPRDGAPTRFDLFFSEPDVVARALHDEGLGERGDELARARGLERRDELVGGGASDRSKALDGAGRETRGHEGSKPLVLLAVQTQQRGRGGFPHRSGGDADSFEDLDESSVHARIVEELDCVGVPDHLAKVSGPPQPVRGVRLRRLVVGAGHPDSGSSTTGEERAGERDDRENECDDATLPVPTAGRSRDVAGQEARKVRRSDAEVDDPDRNEHEADDDQ